MSRPVLKINKHTSSQGEGGGVPPSTQGFRISRGTRVDDPKFKKKKKTMQTSIRESQQKQTAKSDTQGLDDGIYK